MDMSMAVTAFWGVGAKAARGESINQFLTIYLDDHLYISPVFIILLLSLENRMQRNPCFRYLCPGPGHKCAGF